MGKCVACNSDAALKCSACNAAFFCDTICQKKAWPSHKLVCQKPGPATVAAPKAVASSAALPISVPSSVAERSFHELLAFTQSAVTSHVHIPASMTISALLNSEAFCRHAYPGINTGELPEDSPKSLLELLQSATYRPACMRAAERACSKAEEILRNVKAKGKSAGEAMDDKTERALWPQVFSEAFAREVPSIFADSAAANQARILEDLTQLASPFHVLATSDYLTGASLERLTNNSIRFCLQPGPFSTIDANDWCNLLLGDLSALIDHKARWSEAVPLLKAVRHTTPAGVTTSLQLSCAPSVLWADPGEMESEYPAIAELMQRLHALPFELNRKLPAARLVRPQPGMLVIQRFSCSVTNVPTGMDSDEDSPAAIFPFGNHPRSLFGQDGDGRASSMKIVCLASCGQHYTKRAAGVNTFLHHIVETNDVNFTASNQLLLYRGKSCFPMPKLDFQVSDEGAASIERGSDYSCEHFVIAFVVLGKDDSF